MASGGVSSLLADPATLDRVTCPVCIEPYRDPKALSCGHSLCAECVKRQEQFAADNRGLGGAGSRRPSVKCPLCRVVTEVPPTGLATNYVLADILHQFASMDTKDYRTCTICTNRFREENFYYCRKCATLGGADQGVTKGAVCSTCGIDNHSGGEHELMKLTQLKCQNLATAQTVETVKEEIEAELHNIQQTNRAVNDGLHNIVQAVHENMTKKFSELRGRLSDGELFTEEYLEFVTTEVQQLHHRFNTVFQQIRSSQNTVLVHMEETLQHLFDNLTQQQQQDNGVIDAVYGDPQVIDLESLPSDNTPREGANNNVSVLPIVRSNSRTTVQQNVGSQQQSESETPSTSTMASHEENPFLITGDQRVHLRARRKMPPQKKLHQL